VSPLAFDTWLNDYLAEEAIRAKSLLVTILGDSVAPHGGGIWLGALIGLLAPFGVNERLVRTSVFRLAAEGWLVAERQGRRSLYTLSPAGRRRIENADRRIYRQPEKSWDGRWTLVLSTGARSDARQRDLKRDLLWEGYALLAPGLYGHPGKGPGALPDIVHGLDLAKEVALFEASTVPGSTGIPDAQLVRNHWPLDSIAQRYQAFRQRFAPFAHGAAVGLDAKRAFQLCTLLVHAYRRVVLHDPQLPASLLPPDWPGHEAFVECGAIYRTAEQRAEEHFLSVVTAPGAPLTRETVQLMRRFAEALAPLAQDGPV
jgi:phenylacetic acid degradation operon negative regulatory protein